MELHLANSREERLENLQHLCMDQPYHRNPQPSQSFTLHLTQPSAKSKSCYLLFQHCQVPVSGNKICCKTLVRRQVVTFRCLSKAFKTRLLLVGCRQRHGKPWLGGMDDAFISAIVGVHHQRHPTFLERRVFSAFWMPEYLRKHVSIYLYIYIYVCVCFVICMLKFLKMYLRAM